LSSQVNGHKISGSKGANQKNNHGVANPNNKTGCTRIGRIKVVKARDLKRPVCVRNPDSAVKMTTVGLNDNS